MSELRNALSLDVSAEREVEQDFISITFQAIENGTDPNAIQATLKERLSAAVEAARPLKKGGAFRVNTGAMSIRPAYNNKNQQTGYSGVVTLLISGTAIKDIASMTSLVSTMNVLDVEMSISAVKRKKHEDALAKEAIRMFRDKANTYAEAFGAKGCALVNATVRVGQGGGRYRATRSVGAAPMAMSASIGGGDMEIESGKELLSATVNGTIVMVQ